MLDICFIVHYMLLTIYVIIDVHVFIESIKIVDDIHKIHLLTHVGLVTSYRNINLSQQWIR